MGVRSVIKTSLWDENPQAEINEMDLPHCGDCRPSIVITPSFRRLNKIVQMVVRACRLRKVGQLVARFLYRLHGAILLVSVYNGRGEIVKTWF